MAGSRSTPRMSMSNLELSRRDSGLTGGRHHQSILKNGDINSPSHPPTGPFDGCSGAVRHASVSAVEKRARFKEAVDVIIHDAQGNRVIKTDCVKLKSSADDDVDRALLSPSVGRNYKKQIFPADDGPVSTSNAARGRSNVFSLGSMRIERGPNGRRFLRLVVILGEAFTERSVHVQSTKGGSRILVGAYKAEPLGDGTNYMRQYMDRFQLPHPVDSYSIQGEINRMGELIITAPLVEYDNDTEV